jgi:hypothetical protein
MQLGKHPQGDILDGDRELSQSGLCSIDSATLRSAAARGS